MNKKILIPVKPDRSKNQSDADAWVKGENKSMKRLTIDVSEDLHRRIKIGCVSKGGKMADEIRTILEREFPET